TNLISGVTSNWNGIYFVGSNYVFDTLLIQNGGVLTNSIGVIGHNVGANSNAAIVSGSGSIWSTTNNLFSLFIGYSGAANSLVISNGGSVISASSSVLGGYHSQFSLGASNNTALVTGSGSLWSN